MSKKNKTVIFKVFKIAIIILLLVAVVSTITSIIIGLNQPAIEPTKIDLSLDEVIF